MKKTWENYCRRKRTNLTSILSTHQFTDYGSFQKFIASKGVFPPSEEEYLGAMNKLGLLNSDSVNSEEEEAKTEENPPVKADTSIQPPEPRGTSRKTKKKSANSNKAKTNTNRKK